MVPTNKRFRSEIISTGHGAFSKRPSGHQREPHEQRARKMVWEQGRRARAFHKAPRACLPKCRLNATWLRAELRVLMPMRPYGCELPWPVSVPTPGGPQTTTPTQTAQTKTVPQRTNIILLGVTLNNYAYADSVIVIVNNYLMERILSTNDQNGESVRSAHGWNRERARSTNSPQLGEGTVSKRIKTGRGYGQQTARNRAGVRSAARNRERARSANGSESGKGTVSQHLRTRRGHGQQTVHNREKVWRANCLQLEEVTVSKRF